ncbi:hypothetical protein J0895_22485 [Phormidium pseudopriestleyi FRX01]|uniref:Uncharacterized protein n=1 Tax=Phormidium pseudopriestleyi FRX01 TaxID=1759528 RepID=A0ABS3FXD9_9CYAN|nr:hypothetical protein [Phormidium pseudopriestleyi FRX01]
MGYSRSSFDLVSSPIGRSLPVMELHRHQTHWFALSSLNHSGWEMSRITLNILPKKTLPELFH